MRMSISDLLQHDALNVETWFDVLSISLSHESFSHIKIKLNLARREAVLNGNNLIESLPSLWCVDGKSKKQRTDLAVKIVAAGLVSQRKAQEITGDTRESIRKRTPNESITTEHFVRGSRSAIRTWSESLPNWMNFNQYAKELAL